MYQTLLMMPRILPTGQVSRAKRVPAGPTPPDDRERSTKPPDSAGNRRVSESGGDSNYRPFGMRRRPNADRGEKA